MSKPVNSCRYLGAVITVVALSAATPAHAHVKWFASYDVNETPNAMIGIGNATMLGLVAAALVLLWAASRIEQTSIATRCITMLERGSAMLQARMEDLLRASTGAFFVSLWAMGGIILTPELKTDSAWVPLLQLAIAGAMFWRATLPAAAIGIVLLYICGIWSYGIFHMMDYPIFLGLAVYHALSACSSEKWRAMRSNVLRLGAAATLMWASVEKLAYPHWTHPLLDAHAGLSLGLDFGTFMIIAGVVEFSLAFGLLWGPLVRRASAFVLGAMFTAAIFEFGKMDAIGHMMIIAILVAIIFDATPGQRHLWIPRVATCIPALTYIPALVGTVTLYYGSHFMLCGMSILQ